jgi:hypothetical protein
MSESTKARTERLLAMDHATLVMHCQDITQQRDELLQELRYIAMADTIEWDDPTDFELWAKNRARAAIEKVESAK